MNTQTIALTPSIILIVSDDPAITRDTDDVNLGLQALLHQDGALLSWLGYVDDTDDALHQAAKSIADLELADEVFTTDDGFERYLRIGTWAMTANTMGGSFEQIDCGTMEAAATKLADWRQGTLDAIALAQGEG